MSFLINSEKISSDYLQDMPLKAIKGGVKIIMSSVTEDIYVVDPFDLPHSQKDLCFSVCIKLNVTWKFSLLITKKIAKKKLN